MWLQQSFLQVEPEFGAARRSRRQRRQSLFNPILGGRAQLQPMQRHEVKQTQQNFRVLERRSLLQEDEPIHNRKIRSGEL